MKLDKTHRIPALAPIILSDHTKLISRGWTWNDVILQPSLSTIYNHPTLWHIVTEIGLLLWSA